MRITGVTRLLSSSKMSRRPFSVRFLGPSPTPLAGSSPEQPLHSPITALPSNPKYQVMGSPSGVETVRVLFPYTCLTEISKVFKNVCTVAEQPDGTLRVHAYEIEPVAGDVAIYRLSPALVAQRIEMSDVYCMHHRQQEGKGMLKHGLEQDGNLEKSARAPPCPTMTVSPGRA
jgi:hypothetical protein